jgi:hypothetical protein
MQVPHERIPNLESALLLYAHEASRVFRDRLTEKGVASSYR